MDAIDGAVRAGALRMLETAGLRDLAAEASFAGIEGGSDRSFVRIAGAGASVILLSQPPGWEIDAYIDNARFLRANGVGAPRILAFDRGAGLVLMEDLGDRHLEDALAGATEEETAARYREAIGILAALGTTVARAMERDGLLADRVFDERSLLAETDYFVHEFIEGCCPVPLPATWEEERRLLARSLAAEPRVFMHRDFQSRNLMVTGGALRIVDFQTAHRGPGLYDAASLLKDAYHPLPAPLRRELVGELHALLRAGGAAESRSVEEYRRAFVLAGVQRNLQALAAFAKLGLRKGKPKFLDSIPAGLDLLAEGARESASLPGIERLAGELRDRFERKRKG